MKQKNQISFKLTEQETIEIKNAINILQEKLSPHLKSLTPNEKSEMNKMGDKTLAFVTKSMEYIENNPEFIPPYLDANEAKKDFEAVESLRQILHPLSQIINQINDSITLSGSEAYNASLIYYNSVKAAAKNNISNSQIIYDDLNKRFQHGGRKKAKPIETNEENI